MESIGRELKKLLRKHKVSVYKITEDLGIAHESLYRSLKNGSNPEWKRIKQILDYLGYDLKFIKRKEASLVMIKWKTKCPHCNQEVVLKLKPKEKIRCPNCKKEFTPKAKLLSHGQ